MLPPHGLRSMQRSTGESKAASVSAVSLLGAILLQRFACSLRCALSTVLFVLSISMLKQPASAGDDARRCAAPGTGRASPMQSDSFVPHD